MYALVSKGVKYDPTVMMSDIRRLEIKQAAGVAFGVVLMGQVLSGGHLLQVVPLTGLRRVMVGSERPIKSDWDDKHVATTKNIVSHA